MTTSPIPGNPYALPARHNLSPEARGAHALAYEQRLATLHLHEIARANGADTGRRGALEQLRALLTEQAEPEETPAPDYLLTNYAAVRFELLRADVEKIERKMRRINGDKPDPMIRAVLDLIDQHAADRGRGAAQ